MTVLIPAPSTISEKPETIFEDVYNRAINEMKAAAAAGIPITMEQVIYIMGMCQEYEMDGHAAIAGQNGVGKSYVLLMLMKKYMKGANVIPNLLLAKHTTNDFIRFILTRKKTLLGVDELNQYLYYKEHASDEQNHLIQQIELARSRSIIIAGCIRDPRKLTLNYRQGKISIVIWVLDRYTKGGSYAAVFIANPSVESYDKFGFSMIAENLIEMSDVRETFESMPSFVGYMRIPHALDILTQDEIDHYKKEKDKAMAHSHINKMTARFKKYKMTQEELEHEIRMLEPVFGQEEVAAMLMQIPKRSKKKAAETVDE